MQTLFGTKLGMIQSTSSSGEALAVTLVEITPNVVAQVKTTAKDGYDALQMVVRQNNKSISKPLAGHLKASGQKSGHLKEVRMGEESSAKVGDVFDVSVLSVGDKVRVSAISKGKGFAGTVKRHNFDTGPKSHGSQNYRKPGSIGSMYPQNVNKGKKMGGRMGGERVTTKNVEVALVDKERNVVGLNGSVPGPRNGLVEIRGMK